MTILAPMDDARNFLKRVLVWPTQEEPGYCNLHYLTSKINPKTNKPFWGGYPYRSIDDMMRGVPGLMRRDDVRDIYYCTSTQSQAVDRVTPEGKSYKVAMRNQPNAMFIKVFAIDIDIKGGLNGYINQTDANNALIQFLQETKLPRPSIIVGSGGGMHVYWVIDRPLTMQEWQPVAFSLAEATKQHELRCDTQCTIDIARILRVPGTFNMKTGQPRLVKTISSCDVDYPLEAIAKPVEGYKPSGAMAIAAKTLLPSKGALPGVSDLSAGIDTTPSLPIDLKTVVPHCGFIYDALKTGGKDLANPLWNLTTLLATFTDNGRVNAHLMARGHPGYTEMSTDELYKRKETEKDMKGLGWPACATISASGATQCATCPHKTAGKSPFHYGERIQPVVPQIVQQVTPQGNLVNVVTTTPATPTTPFPQGYSQRADGVILYLKEAEDGQKIWLPVCKYPMSKPWLQRDPWIFNFTTKAELGREHQVAIDTAVLETSDMRRALQGQGMVMDQAEYKNVGKFLMSWISHLQSVKGAVISSHPFGWDVKSGKVEGFIYGGLKHSIKGKTPSANPDPVIASQYAPLGERQPWLDAAAMITTQGRPELDAIIAASFAAPLVRATGQSGMLMSAYSIESGIGKSTAMRIAQAVWGDPIRAMQSLGDTSNSVLNKIGEIRSLPLFWDELKTEADSRKFINMAFTLGQGKEKSRLTSRASQKAPGTWQTLLVSASNESLLDMVESQTRATTAGIYRIFEYEVTPGVTGQIDPSDAQRLVAKLNDNYGQVGLDYSEFLGSNWSRIEAEVAAYNRELNAEVNTINDERFWIATITCVVMGARYANELGFVSIDEDKLKAFLIHTLNNMRGVRTTAVVDMKESMNVSNVMSQFFAVMRGRHTLFTNIARTGVGRPIPGSIKIVRDITKLEGIYVRVGMDDKVVRISSSRFNDWLTEKDFPRNVITKALTDKYNAKLIRARIGSGTDFAGPTEYILEIDLMTAPEINFIDEM